MNVGLFPWIAWIWVGIPFLVSTFAPFILAEWLVGERGKDVDV